MQQHLPEPLSIEQLARRSHMSPRTFARRFLAATGTTPHRWLLLQRVRRAQELLETTDQPVEWIARVCGFGSAANLRRHFNQAVGINPIGYRQAFRGSVTDRPLPEPGAVPTRTRLAVAARPPSR
jgi:AraC family transcriptional regulator, transcriptional activator FtrA